MNKIRFTLFDSSSNSITFKFSLYGHQQISSEGVNFKLLGKKVNDPTKYDTLKLYPCGKFNYNVQVIVDDDEYDLTNGRDDVVVKKGQMFSLENHSRSRPCVFFAKLFKDSL